MNESLLIGLLFFAVPLGYFYLQEKRRRKRLIREGVRLEATVTKVGYDTSDDGGDYVCYHFITPDGEERTGSSYWQFSELPPASSTLTVLYLRQPETFELEKIVVEGRVLSS